MCFKSSFLRSPVLSIVSFIRTSPIRNPNNTSAKKKQIKEQKFGAIGNSDDGKIRLLFLLLYNTCSIRESGETLIL